jgi:CubicO group peptidase (beta-lactamase class C family)
VAALDRTRGPYTSDRGDAHSGIPPAVVVACLAAGLRRRRRRGAWTAAAVVAWSLSGGVATVSAQSAGARHDLTPSDLTSYADSVLGDYLRHSPEPSLALVVVRGDSLLFVRGYGSEDRAGTRAVDPDATVFWLASLSKVVTADAVMREWALGRVILEAPAARYLGWPLPSRRGWPAVTVAHLLTHTSGLDEPFMSGAVDDTARLEPLDAYLARVRWRAGTRPGELLRYSNHGMALAGRVVEAVSGAPFAEYVEREIFRPLGMRHTTFRQPMPPELARRLATAGTDGHVDFLPAAPAGAMVGTAADMGRFLLAQLDTAGADAARRAAMWTTRWRAHPDVPGVAVGWFETRLGGVSALYHTGARHHFSVLWMAPSRRLGVFLVHSMRQGGPFQNLRAEFVRGFVERYLVPETDAAPQPASPVVDGVYRPLLLGTTAVERAGYLLLDTRVTTAAGGGLTMRAPGGLGTITARPIGGGAYEVGGGPHAGLRLGFVTDHGTTRIAVGGSLLDPLVFTRLRWWERGTLHAALLGGACLALSLAAVIRAVRRLVRRRPAPSGPLQRGWTVAAACGAMVLLALGTGVVTLLTMPELGAASHLRGGVRIARACFAVASVLGVALPVLALLSWRAGWGRASGRVLFSLTALAGLVAAVLLVHYRLAGLRL